MAMKMAYVVRLRRAEATAERISLSLQEERPVDYSRAVRAVNRYLRLAHQHDQMALTHVSGFA
jgi:hypothetical protein